MRARVCVSECVCAYARVCVRVCACVCACARAYVFLRACEGSDVDHDCVALFAAPSIGGAADVTITEKLSAIVILLSILVAVFATTTTMLVLRLRRLQTQEEDLQVK